MKVLTCVMLIVASGRCSFLVRKAEAMLHEDIANLKSEIEQMVS